MMSDGLTSPVILHAVQGPALWFDEYTKIAVENPYAYGRTHTCNEHAVALHMNTSI
jgi:hypothetical protein